MAQRKREFCKKCNQVTTHTKEPKEDWLCLCCESAKFRSNKATEAIKAKAAQKPRLNLRF
jgi:hypothetical protein